jgi:hypothetical protein
MPAQCFIKNDPEKLAAYIKSRVSGLVVFDGRPGAGKTYLANDMAQRLGCKSADADRDFLDLDRGMFFEALRLDEMRSSLNASLVLSPLVLLSTILARRVVERLEIAAAAFVWVESLDDYDDPPEAIVGIKPTKLRAEVATYMEAYKARDRADVLYVNAWES